MNLIVETEVEGEKNIPEGGCILVANHRSDLDPVILSFSISRPITWIAGKYLFNIPFIKDFLKRIGAIPISKDKKTIDKALRMAEETLKKGGVIGIFPEGWSSIGKMEQKKVGKFQTGFARLALLQGCPVVPVGIIGTKEKMEKFLLPDWIRLIWGFPEHLRSYTRRVVFTKARIKIGKPLYFQRRKRITYKRLQEVSEETRIAVEKLLE
jgi:1-acyl-sn-glycerol-3-phosphate acyltransferase